MRVGINASFARKPNTGIGQVTLNFLRKLSELTTNSSRLTTFKFILYSEEDLPADIKLPENWKKRAFLPVYKRDDLIRKIWWEKFLLPKKVREDKCDVFISLYQSATVIARSVATKQSLYNANESIAVIAALPSVARNDNKIDHIMVVHDVIPKLFPEYLNNLRKKLYWKLTERAIKKADKIIAVSHRTEKDLVQRLGVDPEKISVNHIDVDEIYKKEVHQTESQKVLKKYGLNPGYIYCGGGLEVRKNIEGVIRAYKYLLERNKNLHYVHKFPDLVISGKLMPQLAPLVTDAEKLVKELNLTQHIKLLDFIPQEDLPALYKNAIMFVYPSFYEGFGLPVLEAMNVGTPVITSKKSSLPEVGRDSVLYCNPDDIPDIAMVIKNLLINKFLREKLSERSKERAQYFSWEKFVEKIFHVIENLK